LIHTWLSELDPATVVLRPIRTVRQPTAHSLHQG